MANLLPNPDASTIKPAHSILIEPVINYPRVAQIGKKYLLSIDLKIPDTSQVWPFEEEEYTVYCFVETEPLFENEPIGESALVLHRFGGTYGPAMFYLSPAKLETSGSITVRLVNGWGIPLDEFQLKNIRLVANLDGIETNHEVPVATIRRLKKRRAKIPIDESEVITISDQKDKRTLKNPFIFGSPVSSEEFIGRSKEIRRIASHVTHGQSVAIVAEPQMGKASLLRYLAASENRQELYGEWANHLLFQYIDAHTLGLSFTQTQFWWLALAPLQEKLLEIANTRSKNINSLYIDENKTDGVFVSYALGEETEQIVDDLEKTFAEHNIRVVRDKKDLNYKSSIEEFEQRIEQGQAIILVISDKFLRSEHCMYELMELSKNQEALEHIFPIVLEDAHIYEAIGRLAYIKYWEDKISKLDEAIKQVSIKTDLDEITSSLDKYTRIRAQFDHLIELLSTMSALTPNIHESSAFSTIITALESKRTTKKRSTFESLSKTDKSSKINDSALASAYENCKDEEFSIYSLEKLLVQLKIVGWRLVLLLDEFDSLLNHPVLNQAKFYGGLRSLATRYESLTLVVASHQSLESLNGTTQEYSRLGSPYFNFMMPIVLGAFTEKDARGFLERGDKYFSEADMDFLFYIAGGHPALLQAAAYALWEAYDEGEVNRQLRWEITSRELLDAAQPILADTWRTWSPETRKAVTIVALDTMPRLVAGKEFDIDTLLVSLPMYGPEIEELRKRGFLVTDSYIKSGYRLQAQVMLWWLAAELIRVTRPQDGDDLGEWLRNQELDGLLRGNEKSQLKKALTVLSSLLNTGTEAFIKASAEGFAKGLGIKH